MIGEICLLSFTTFPSQGFYSVRKNKELCQGTSWNCEQWKLCLNWYLILISILILILILIFKSLNRVGYIGRPRWLEPTLDFTEILKIFSSAVLLKLSLLLYMFCVRPCYKGGNVNVWITIETKNESKEGNSHTVIIDNKKGSFLILTIIYEFGNVFKLHCAVDTPRLFFLFIFCYFQKRRT